MNVKPLYYSTQAIAQLSQTAQLFRHTMPKSADNIEFTIGMLRKAVKFRLPDKGIIIDAGFRAMPSVLRLPYPVVAAEFYCPDGGDDVDKCIALAFENADEAWDRFGCNFTGMSITIIQIFHSPIAKDWIVSQYVSKIPNSKQCLPRLRGVQINFFPEMPPATPDERDQSTTHSTYAILNMIEVLSCSNVFIEAIPAPKAVNKKRIAKGNLPLYEYKILTLTTDEKRSSQGPGGGTHASPRVHLRRGHIRRLRDKKIWINATVVGNRKAGMVVKDYEVKA